MTSEEIRKLAEKIKERTPQYEPKLSIEVLKRELARIAGQEV